MSKVSKDLGARRWSGRLAADQGRRPGRVRGALCVGRWRDRAGLCQDGGDGKAGTVTAEESQMSKDAEMPGAWICDKCGFILQKNILFASNGNVSADTSPLNVICENDGQLLRPLTWREVNNDLFKMLDESRKELALERKRMDWLDNHCSFVADYDYNIGPFKVGELRRMAEAGLAIDEGKAT